MFFPLKKLPNRVANYFKKTEVPLAHIVSKRWYDKKLRSDLLLSQLVETREIVLHIGNIFFSRVLGHILSKRLFGFDKFFA